jgi:hypothetical protein
VLGLAIVLVTLGGAWLRLYAIDFGLPDRFRPDEELIVDRAARLGGAAGWNPKFAEYPAGQIYAIRAVGSLAQRFVGKRWSIYEPSGIRGWYLTARRLSALLGTATIPLAGAFAARMSVAGGNAAAAGPAGLVGAALVAGSFLHARDSHFATTDVAMTFWVTLAWLAIVNVAERGRRRDSLGAGALVGVATATKYPALSLLVPLALAHLGRAGGPIGQRRSSSEAERDSAATAESGSTLARLALASVALLLAFTAVTPYVVLDAVSTRGAVANIGGQVFTDKYVNGGGSLAWLFVFAWPAAVGWPLAVPAIGAACASAVLGGRIERLVVVWLVVSSLPLVFSHLVFLRYLLPLIPATMALIAVWIARITGRARGVGYVALAVVVAALVPSIVRAVELDRLVRETDTRSLAREWMETHLPAGTRIHSSAFVPGFPFYVPAALRGEFFYLPLAEGEEDRLPAGSYVLVATHPLAARIASDKLEGKLGDDAELLFDFDPTNRGTTAPSSYEPADAFFAPLSGFTSVVRPGPRLTLFRLGR